MSDPLWPYILQHTRLPCLSLSPRVWSNSRPLSPWCYVTLFSFCLQSFPASRSFPMNQLFTSVAQSTEASASASVLPVNIQGWFPTEASASASVLPVNIQGWFPLGLTVFSSTTIQKHQFFGPQPSLWPSSHIHSWLLEKPQLWPDRPLVAK